MCVCLAVCVGGVGVHRTSVARSGIGLRGNKHGRMVRACLLSGGRRLRVFCTQKE